MVSRTCECCRKEFSARQADVNRGWARFCSKSCKAISQENKTGQYKKLLKDNNRKKEKVRKSSLLETLNEKIYRMNNPINVEPNDPWDYDGPHGC